jgi:hypothetical protein
MGTDYPGAFPRDGEGRVRSVTPGFPDVMRGLSAIRRVIDCPLRQGDFPQRGMIISRLTLLRLVPSAIA